MTFKTVQLINEQVVTLHSTVRSAGTGNERNNSSYVSFELPRHTVKWYYTFTTVKSGTSFIENLKLGVQVAKLIPMPASYKAGVIAVDKILNSIKVPNGTKEINSYVLNDLQSAYNCVGNKQFNYLIGSEMLNTKSGKKDLHHLPSTTYYVALQNLSALYAVDVKIEAVAIIMESSPEPV